MTVLAGLLISPRACEAGLVVHKENKIIQRKSTGTYDWLKISNGSKEMYMDIIKIEELVPKKDNEHLYINISDDDLDICSDCEDECRCQEKHICNPDKIVLDIENSDYDKNYTDTPANTDDCDGISSSNLKYNDVFKDVEKVCALL